MTGGVDSFVEVGVISFGDVGVVSFGDVFFTVAFVVADFAGADVCRAAGVGLTDAGFLSCWDMDLPVPLTGREPADPGREPPDAGRRGELLGLISLIMVLMIICSG